ncbi:MAG: aminotransferase class I/II-fold pyridoxal phosphate-dependent enzyme [Chitinophagales bacterium]
MMNQYDTPLFDAVKKYIADQVVPFHVPGHKQGQGIPELRDYLGERVFNMDVNGMEDLDYINNPTGVILQAQELLASAYGAKNAYFLVNGTTSGVQAMIMSSCEPGSEIIIPRNAHRSTFGGIILSGAHPIYVQPEINKELGFAMGVTAETIRKAVRQHPHAKAVFLINPTYYGFASDLASITAIAHSHNMAVLVDEAHGAHLPFHDDLPLSAMHAGADISAASIHKTAGSMTQSSVLLLKSKLISHEKVKEVLNLNYTSSASYVLLCSLDVARKQLATRGTEILSQTLETARWARKQINQIPGLHASGKELVGIPGCFEFDETKLGINVRGLGCTGYQVEAMLRRDYNIQIELSDLYNILAILSVGDSMSSVEILCQALKDMVSKTEFKYFKNSTTIPYCPEMVVTPRDAFYSPKVIIPLEESVGQISGEMVMAYPPGIPVICMGERVTREIIDYIKILKEEKCELQGTADSDVNYIRVLGTRKPAPKR